MIRIISKLANTVTSVTTCLTYLITSGHALVTDLLVVKLLENHKNKIKICARWFLKISSDDFLIFWGIIGTKKYITFDLITQSNFERSKNDISKQLFGFCLLGYRFNNVDADDAAAGNV